MRATNFAVLLSSCLALSALGCEAGIYNPTGPDDESQTGDPDDEPGGDTDDPVDTTPDDPAVANYTIALDAISGEMVLGEKKEFLVTITSENAFAGPVALATGVLPTGWVGTFDPASVEVPADGTATAKLTLAIATNAEAANAEWKVQATAAPGIKEVAVTVLVKPELVIRIPANALNAPAMSFGGSVKTRKFAIGTKVTWINGDIIDHRIHGVGQSKAADGSGGLNHEPDNLKPGAAYSVMLYQSGSFNYNCHIHGAMTGQIVIE